MKIILTGATGMVGGGVLRRCLERSEVEEILVISRRDLSVRDAKLKVVLHEDFFDISSIKEKLGGYDACFYCLGVTSVGLGEEGYRRITYDMTVHVAKVLAELNPKMVFSYISGMGVNAEKTGSLNMWVRVKNEVERALLAMPFKRVFLIRPGLIQPRKGAGSTVPYIRFTLMLVAPVFPLLLWLFPGFVTSTDRIADAMIRLSRGSAQDSEPIESGIENRRINELGA